MFTLARKRKKSMIANNDVGVNQTREKYGHLIRALIFEKRIGICCLPNQLTFDLNICLRIITFNISQKRGKAKRLM